MREEEGITKASQPGQGIVCDIICVAVASWWWFPFSFSRRHDIYVLVHLMRRWLKMTQTNYGQHTALI